MFHVDSIHMANISSLYFYTSTPELINYLRLHFVTYLINMLQEFYLEIMSSTVTQKLKELQSRCVNINY